MTEWPEIFFARHGETDWNAAGKFQGRMDIPLNEKGQRQADAIGPVLASLLASRGMDPAALAWHASPLSRARETMQRARSAFDSALPPVVHDDRLMELAYGVMEGQHYMDVDLGIEMQSGKRSEDYWEFRPPEGENYHDLTRRLTEFAETLTGPSVIVAHGGVQRALRRLTVGTPVVELVNWMPPQGAIAHFHDGQMDMHHAPGFEPG